MRYFAGFMLLVVSAAAQVTTTPVRRSITASGQGQVDITPDQARISIAVVTQSATADDAVMQNAAKAQAVIDAVKALIGNAGSVRTTFYNVSPVRDTTSRITGYTVTNSILATVNNLTITGRVMDAAVGAGANRIDGLTLGLRDDEPVRQQALRAAGQVAKARASSIAAGLGVTLGQVLSAAESGVVVPVISVGTGAPTAATPIEAGTLTVTARITAEYEILQ